MADLERTEIGPIDYVCVGQNARVLVEAQSSDGNFGQVAQLVVRRTWEALDGEPRRSYEYDDRFFHILRHNALVFVCLAPARFPRRMAFAFLNEVRDELGRRVAGALVSLQPVDVPASFSAEMLTLMGRFSSPAWRSRMDRVKSQIEETKTIMIENIDKVLDRGEHLEIIAKKVELLEENSFALHSAAKANRRAMCCMSYRLTLMIVLLLVVLLLFAAALIVIAALGVGIFLIPFKDLWDKISG